ncbi:hypothetical protein Pint_36415 [Pistacia integerrima]|uniref:Uncharacterized protein n=1 Tax=Pistacia integerrima TaxID=434235 RepID=A0ACC0Y1Z3_9ROSI|nr:hypothetical protein Pint_36415 [Pistacia integerrima]
MDPIPPINKVFSLVSQEAHQRNVNVTFVGFGGQRKDNLNSNKPVCTHCGYVSHTIYKCYKLHGYPPKYKAKSKSNTSHQASSSETPAIAN